MKLAALSLVSAATAKVHLQDKFESLDGWKMSHWKGTSEMQDFELKPTKYGDEKNMCLATVQDARFYAASKQFEPFSNKDKTLVVQYEATFDKDVECGGGYLKMGPKMEDQEKFGDPTEYSIMFGPDKCGSTRRTHLIFNYKGKNVLKKNDLPYKQQDEGLSVLYRMVLKSDNQITVKINDEEVYSGKLGDDWEMLEAKEIDDPEEKKPSDWVDEEMMDDPDDKKPDDWVEDKEVQDKDAKKPEDWDAEEDGEWEAPMIPNPDYKGEWKAKRITNPGWKGVWAPKKIANPKYVADDNLYLMNSKDIGFVGFDLWQVKASSRFDNLIIATGADEKEATKEADEFVETWKATKDAQKKAKDSTTTTTTTTEAAEVDKDDDDVTKEEKEGEDL